MGETADQIDRIEKNISHFRGELRRSVSELEEKASATLRWRTHYEAKPFAVLGAVFAGGLLLSRVLFGGRRCR